jgi:hypothetical protein
VSPGSSSRVSMQTLRITTLRWSNGSLISKSLQGTWVPWTNQTRICNRPWPR